MAHTRKKKLTLLNFDQKDKIEELAGEISNLEARTALTRAAAEKAKASLQKKRVEAAETLEYQKTKEQEYTNNFDQITEDKRKRLEKLIAVEITKSNTLRKESANFDDQIDALKLTVPELESQFLEEQSKTLERFVEENQGVFSTLELIYERANGHDEAKTQYDSNMEKTLHRLRKVKPTRSLNLFSSEQFSRTIDLNFFKPASQDLLKVEKCYREVLENLIPDYAWSQFDEYCNSLPPMLNEADIMFKADQEVFVEWNKANNELHKEYNRIFGGTRFTPQRKLKKHSFGKLQYSSKGLSLHGRGVKVSIEKLSSEETEYIEKFKQEFSGREHEVTIQIGGQRDAAGKFRIYFKNNTEQLMGYFVNKDCPFPKLIEIEKNCQKVDEKYHLVSDNIDKDIFDSIDSDAERLQQTRESWFVFAELTDIIHQHLDKETYTQLRENYLAMEENKSISLSYIEKLGYGGNT